MHIQVSTVQGYLKETYAALNVRSRAELVNFVRDISLENAPPPHRIAPPCLGGRTQKPRREPPISKTPQAWVQKNFPSCYIACMENFSMAPTRPINFLFPFSAPAGIVALYASHEQIDTLLVQTMIALADQGHSLAVIVADNHFDAYELARRVDGDKIKVARGETPHQVRQLVLRLRAARASYSVAIVSGLLEPFYDEQIKWQMARTLLADTLQLLDDLARTLHVFVLVTPPPKPTRPYLQAQVTRAVAHSIELPALANPDTALQGRLFEWDAPF
jgi:hypothetical protein